MRDIDPITQVETIRKRSISPALMMYMAMAQDFGVIPYPKIPKQSNYPPWYEISLSKSERKELSYDDQQELKRYRWTLKKIRDREIWPGMIL